MAKSRFIAIIVFALFSVLILNWVVAAQAKDLYKILGVDKTASQREIQKAFHRLSLKYHPDKNKAKDAQSKFAEISNAYDILSDEEKRKQYDMFGDEPRGQQDYGQHSSSFRHNGNPNGGQRFYTSEDMGQSHQQQYTYREQAGPNGFHFHFGGPGGGSFPFSDFMQDMFGEGMGNMFGEGMGKTFGEGMGKTFSKFKSQGSHHGGSGFKQSFFRNMGKNEEMDMFSSEIKQLNSAEFKTLVDGGDTSLILFFMPDNVGLQEKVSVLEEVARKYGNIVKVAAVNCDSQKKLCKGQKLKFPMTVPKLFVYPWIPSGKRDGLEYTGDWSEKALLSYFTQFLPRLSTRLEASNFDTIFARQSHIPKALLLTKKSETPAIWRYLSGSFSNRIEFFDMQIQSLSDPIARKFNLHNVPAVVGILANGEQLLLSDNIDHNKPASAAENLLELLKSLELKNKEAVRDMPVETAVPLLSKANIHKICSDSTPLCVIGVYKSKKSHDKLFKMLEEVSKKTLLRMVTSLKPSVSYCLLDGNKQSSFLKAFEDKNIRNQDMVLIAYKPRKGKFAVHKGDLKTESVETFITGSLSGDIIFQKLKQKPTLL